MVQHLTWVADLAARNGRSFGAGDECQFAGTLIRSSLPAGGGRGLKLVGPPEPVGPVGRSPRGGGRGLRQRLSREPGAVGGSPRAWVVVTAAGLRGRTGGARGSRRRALSVPVRS